jgi:hypothetical protein
MSDRPLYREPMLYACGLVVATAIARFALGYDEVPVLANHISFTAAIAPLALVGAGLAPAAALTALAGLWLAVSPWVLGYADEGVAAWAIDLAAGLALIGLGAVSALPLGRRTVAQLEALDDRDGDPVSSPRASGR